MSCRTCRFPLGLTGNRRGTAELVGDYIQMHVRTAHDSATDEAQAVQELVDAMRSYLK
jgi:hypothetical protein